LLVQQDVDPLRSFGVIVDDRRPSEVLVVRVIPDSPAFVAGIRPGDVITTFRGNPVRGRSQFVEVIQQVPPGQVAVQVNRNRQVRDLTVDMPRVPSSTAVRRSAARPDYDIDRPAIERREERRENRIERREERRDGPEPAAVPVETAPPSPPLIPRPFRGNR
jgi:C-terminal processing protease CtpA/Prc